MTRFYTAACQIDRPNPRHWRDISPKVDHQVAMIEQTLAGYRPFGDVRLFAFPEFSHAAPVYFTAAELLEHLALPIPNPYTDRYLRIAQREGIYIQTGTFLESDDRFPGHVFNTTCLIGPEGILYRYRKTHPWIPWEVHTSPHDLPNYPDEPFPVAETPIGRIGAAICYDWLFPEAIRMLAMNGAEILIRISAYMDPWGATPPMDWWTMVNRCRAMENMAYVVASNQAASFSNYPPFSWPGGSMVVDFDGRILAQANPGPGDQVVIAPIDLAALRQERERRQGHHLLGHLRTELYRHYQRPAYDAMLPRTPSGSDSGVLPPSIESNEAAIRAAKIRRARPDA
ncbi:nitrilase-related carbon-nitrogen hydrolase [Tuwongella immobilis]|uniref:CN hydrolase domain-containing protein n=1 Tax=Tuwongella immobilis TaxID=692036 RepID=A0A6C2YN34_9BACT|nr:nitrilase-related carbon-nitrogen hydrolase [Tuwongella immobilis]VIP02533.1 nitrilase cyanide hydratase and apolipoprotein n-acyltransferase : Putative amidohydrolase OS=Singulisphaera acidiphila (strain ATCC BAA-1392 / DSM 18658 / VKM B-2454 / MOB10) GN=Sinac_1701 PE=4 SV=1: CN_hydrolase [Tuwongella immobilis]VTS01688.1 nitrilase cyanide hydratase and apolipoprotein n-acyltransferase : Putative amidohydrolase OS=Singulisphaera acidiphila (strain ATCC BAA-1392 / DSM 18658 / VKM B-2454 / MOB10